ncbi:MAG: NAD(P)/FAD-dependent oxidoreductase [Anaerotignaceae bacterium]
MIRVQNLKLKPNEEKEILLEKACKKLRLDKKSVLKWKIVKQSLDARKKGNIFFIYTIDVKVENESRLLRTIKDKDVAKAVDAEYILPAGKANMEKRPIVVGFGPAGMFAALTLCQMGLKPIVLERGRNVEQRTADVEKFWQEGILDTTSNVQFGEGGAGTFSDGKLTARSKDIRCKKVFTEFVNNGAPKEIMYVHNPHIGTDKLRDVVKNIRENIVSMGGEIRFEARLTDIEIKNNEVTAVEINGSERLECSDIVLAIGHSARDTFEMLYNKGVDIRQKPFAMGVRIEHKQAFVDSVQFGEFAGEKNLGPAEYKFTYHTTKGRSTYTFCMCPGGFVVAASSEENMVAINGMSYYSRDGENANSALLVQINEDDFGSKHPLAGMYFQRDLEKKAFDLGGKNYNAPVQRVGDFLQGKKSTTVGEVKNTYTPNIQCTDLNQLFPDFMAEAMKEAIVGIGKRFKGFDDENALLTAVESRSSSPIRLERNLETGESVNVLGLYPTGEGAGYAGGIVSAAVDGILTAERIFEKYRL